MHTLYIFSRFGAYNTHMHTHTLTHTHTHTHTSQDNGTEEKLFEKKGFQGRFKRTDRGRMTDRNRELVPDSWSLASKRESADHWTLSGGMVV